MSRRSSADERVVHEAMVALRPRLRRFALGLCGSPDDAEDLVQGAFERALARLDQWRPGTRLDSWLYRIVQTSWLDQVRAHRVREAYSDGERRELAARAREAPPPMDAHLTLADVQRRLGEMPDGQRAALLLVAVEGLSYDEAAAVLGVPVGTVTSRLSRARRFLSERLGDGADAR